jgi:hypothetical protein
VQKPRHRDTDGNSPNRRAVRFHCQRKPTDMAIFMTHNFHWFIEIKKATKPNGIMKHFFEIEIFTIYKYNDA